MPSITLNSKYMYIFLHNTVRTDPRQSLERAKYGGR